MTSQCNLLDPFMTQYLPVLLSQEKDAIDIVRSLQWALK